MGLKTTNYTVEKYGIVLPTAYAQISDVNVDLEGEAYAIFNIQQTREDILTNDSIEIKSFTCTIDKKLPIYSQIYTEAKNSLFVNWEDDIVDTVTE